MSESTLFIKNMVCNRCIMVVNDNLSALGYTINNIELGKVVVREDLNSIDVEQIRQILATVGFELIDDKKSSIINRIKTLIIEFIHYDRELPEYKNLSEVLSVELRHDYSYLSHLFSSVEGRTIEKYLILQKIEKVKELLVYDELSLNEIAYQLGYSSPQHLSKQFKGITGLTPSHYKEIKEKKRKPLDEL